MSGENAVSKKIESARKTVAPVPRMHDVLNVFTKKLEKTLRSYLGVVVEAMILDVETKNFSDVLDAISMPAMIGIVEVDGVDRAAIANLTLDLVHHTVDLRLGGEPGEATEFGARRPTSIDSAMCETLVNQALDAFVDGLIETFGYEAAIDAKCSSFEFLPMLANIASERADVLCIQVSLDIGEAARSGDFELVLPYFTLDRIGAKIRAGAGPNSTSGADAWSDHMMDVVLDSELELTPVLHSSRFSVAELSRLSVGDVIAIEPGAHSSIELRLDLRDKEMVVAQAKLGAFKGLKALKLTQDPDQEFLSPLRELTQKPRR